ncbi:uncharacterized protein LOC126809026 [Patella vulgata]|uniref:uncharacterized protein LOC126809026 n=1 Tax=Patella vulgata TaxID=6465 RepID=UPI0024A9B921|nr:uncharacterized protein LOC126809026 [Patella vulgata]
MSLLFIKTKDLTWQDHTLNIEAMLAPTRSQLLVNKHKSYGARATTDKDLYEKQKVTRLKDYVIEKRMMERRKQRINKRQREIYMDRSHSMLSSGNRDDDDVETKSNLSDSQLLKIKSSACSMRSKTSSVASKSPTYHPRLPTQPRCSSLQALNTENMEITCEDIDKGVFITEFIRNDSKLPTVPKSAQEIRDQRNVSFASIRDDHHYGKSKYFNSNGRIKPLQARIEEFLVDQKNFNEDPKQKSPISVWDKIGRNKNKQLVANKLSSLTLDKTTLEGAFDHFCEENSKENFHKMVKMATKLKARVAIARNQSWVPSMSAIKFSKTFLSVLEKKRHSERDLNLVPI